jgi:hypothetical protein
LTSKARLFTVHADKPKYFTVQLVDRTPPLFVMFKFENEKDHVQVRHRLDDQQSLLAERPSRLYYAGI